MSNRQELADDITTSRSSYLFIHYVARGTIVAEHILARHISAARDNKDLDADLVRFLRAKGDFDEYGRVWALHAVRKELREIAACMGAVFDWEM
jgi:hypothetical protein